MNALNTDWLVIELTRDNIFLTDQKFHNKFIIKSLKLEVFIDDSTTRRVAPSDH